MGKSFRLGARLHYPVTIQRILVKHGDTVAKKDTILEYSYVWYKEVGDDTRSISDTQRIVTTVPWSSPTDGVIQNIALKQGEVIHRDTECIVIEELCSHEIQFQGMCAVCGMDMTTVSWASEERDTDRAPINMTHDHTNLTVSQAAAQKYATEQQKRLLEARKLSLVVDLDQTIIHACIDPTVGEWQKDPSNPNYDAIKDVRSFQLNDEGPRGMTTGCWYYIKLRPGLQEFLENMSELYELHVYTMGTRAYAKNIAKLVDPDQKLFGNRLISRDESGSLTAKSLGRLFPTSTGMVAIIDDRADVWPRDRENLIKVVPYDFFKGIGDINSSFLPKRQDIGLSPEFQASEASQNGKTPEDIMPSTDAAPSGNKDIGQNTNPQGVSTPDSTIVELASIGGDDIVRQKQEKEQEHLLERQLKERPLLHQQEQLDKEDDLANASQMPEFSSNPTPRDDTPSSQNSTHQRHNLLRDDDTELIYLSSHLTGLHNEFYKDYDRRRQLADVEENGNVNSLIVPHVGAVLSKLKKEVLSGTFIVLSGLIPVDIPARTSELGRQVVSFGASLKTQVSSKVTHLVISTARPRTQKVREAAKIPSIQIVNQNWLLDCMSQWRKLDTKPYLVKVHPADRFMPPGPKDTPDQKSEMDDNPKQELLIDEDDGFNSDDENASHVSDEDEELEELRQYDVEDEELSSPIKDIPFNWDNVDNELAEYLGSDGDDDDDDDYDSEDEDEGEESSDSEKKQKRLPVIAINGNGIKRKPEEVGCDEDGGNPIKRPKIEEMVNGNGARRAEEMDEDVNDEDAALEAELAAMLESDEP